MLQCPICQQPLTASQASWQCPQGHSFDQARQGYLNLHVVQHKHSKTPGDTPESVAARRRFLAAGHYQPLQQAVCDTVAALHPQTVLDIGCGEGYYTQALAQVVPQVIGLDIAKTAIQQAARADQGHRVQWLVGTGAVLPVLDGRIDLCASLFSPLPKAEMLRVLRPGGHLLVATPAPDHLRHLREALFDEVRPHSPEKILSQLAPGFALIQQQTIVADLALDAQALADLVAMTPYAYKARLERRQTLLDRGALQTQAQFMLYVLKVEPMDKHVAVDTFQASECS